jgi:hypothetical protein
MNGAATDFQVRPLRQKFARNHCGEPRDGSPMQKPRLAPGLPFLWMGGVERRLLPMSALLPGFSQGECPRR